MRILKVVLGIGAAIGFGALAQTAGQTSTTPYTTTDQSGLGTGGSGDGGTTHGAKHKGDGGTKPHPAKPVADAGTM